MQEPKKTITSVIKVTFQDPGYNFDKVWWAGVDVKEPSQWYYPVFSDEQLMEMLEIFSDWPGIEGVEVIQEETWQQLKAELEQKP